MLGFAVSPEAAAAPHLLPYGEIPGLCRLGFAVDHAVLSTTLLDAAARLPHVTLWHDARVTALDLSAPEAATVTVTGDIGVMRVRARLVVAADGATSMLRRLASIGHTRVHLSRMVGLQVTGDIPSPGYLVYLRRRDRPGSLLARLRAVFRLSLATLRMLAQAYRWRPGHV